MNGEQLFMFGNGSAIGSNPDVLSPPKEGRILAVESLAETQMGNTLYSDLDSQDLSVSSANSTPTNQRNKVVLSIDRCRHYLRNAPDQYKVFWALMHFVGLSRRDVDKMDAGMLDLNKRVLFIPGESGGGRLYNELPEALWIWIDVYLSFANPARVAPSRDAFCSSLNRSKRFFPQLDHRSIFGRTYKYYLSIPGSSESIEYFSILPLYSSCDEAQQKASERRILKARKAGLASGRTKHKMKQTIVLGNHFSASTKESQSSDSTRFCEGGAA